MVEQAQILDLVRAAAQAANTVKASNIVAYDVSKQLAITDVFLIASADSDRQVLAVADEIERTLKQDFHKLAQSREGLQEAQWVLMDYGSFVIHVMHTQAREYYDLESLWKDCPQLELNLSHTEDEVAL